MDEVNDNGSYKTHDGMREDPSRPQILRLIPPRLTFKIKSWIKPAQDTCSTDRRTSTSIYNDGSTIRSNRSWYMDKKKRPKRNKLSKAKYWQKERDNSYQSPASLKLRSPGYNENSSITNRYSNSHSLTPQDDDLCLTTIASCGLRENIRGTLRAPGKFSPEISGCYDDVELGPYCDSDRRPRPFQCTFCFVECKDRNDWEYHERHTHVKQNLSNRLAGRHNRDVVRFNGLTTAGASKNGSAKEAHKNWFWNCGFCETLLRSWKERREHIATHFERGLTMTAWDPLRSPYPLTKLTLIPVEGFPEWEPVNLLALQRPTLQDLINMYVLLLPQ